MNTKTFIALMDINRKKYSHTYQYMSENIHVYNNHRIQKYRLRLAKTSMHSMEQNHARAAQSIVRTHPSFSKLTWRLRNSPGITTSYRTDGQTQIDILTVHSSAQKTGSSELWRILMTSRIVCCLPRARQQKYNQTCLVFLG